MDIKKKIEELRKIIMVNNKKYYEEDDPDLDDAEYDALINELKVLEEKYPEFDSADSPSKYVGGKPTEKFSKYEHKYPMLSLSNAFNNDDLLNFVNQISKTTNDSFSFYIEPKIDGLSISLVYSKGKLIKAVTRGDGVIGEDVTENVYQIKTIPKKLDDKSEYLEVRGEIYLSKSEFAKINHEKSQVGEKLFANPRNAASGTLRQLDSKIVAQRNLDCWIYYYFGDLKFKTHSDALIYLGEIGFKINPLSQEIASTKDILDKINEFTEIRPELEYEIDGLVIKVNQLDLYEKIGYTSKFPKWAIAYKFPAEVSKSKLINIVPTLGRTGRITYNAVLEPVLLAGTIVKSATLHNAEFIMNKDIRINSIVKLKKAGDIIPEVIGSVKDDKFFSLKKFNKIDKCPICKSILMISEGEIDQYCINENCVGKIVKKLEHFVSRPAMNIEGLSVKIICKLYEAELIKDITDLYKLYLVKDRLIKLDKMGDKLVSNILNAIEISKGRSAELLLFGLGIRYIGKKMSDILLANFQNLDNLFTADYETLTKIGDVGPIAAKSIVDWYHDKKNVRLITKLKYLGLNTNYLKSSRKIVNQNIIDKKFVITGTLSKSRNFFKDLIEENAGIVTTAITSATDFLLCGDNPGSKLEKANSLNIRILTEDELLKLIESENYEETKSGNDQKII